MDPVTLDRRLREELARAGELIRAGTFEWHGNRYWMDRERHLVLAAVTAERFGVLDQETVPGEPAELAKYGCRHSSTRARELVAVMASLIAGAGRERDDSPLCAELCNFAVVQRGVNAPFAALFWLALEVEVRPGSPQVESLAERVGPLCVDLAVAPVRRDSPRAAQVAFVRDYFESTLADAWLTAPESEWAAYCDELLGRHGTDILDGELANTVERLTPA